MSEVGAVQFIFLLLLFFVLFLGILARKLQTPYPIVMVIGGLVLSFIPIVPGITLNPDLIFLVVLPPLLYASAWTTSWRDFRYNLVSIFSLAFGLVGFTVIGVALAAPKVFSGFDWRLGLVLGAIVAPTDAIAATSIARQVGLPTRIVDVLEGESLLNDASGLLALEFATTILVKNRIPSVSTGFLTLAWLVVGGIAFGLAVGWLVNWIERRIDHGPIEIILSILVPYAAYLAANAVHASGVLAVVACGLFLARRSANFFSPSVRIQVWSVWESLTFVLNGLVFVLIGLQLPAVRAALHEYSTQTLLLDGAIFSALLILLRLLWVFPGARLAYFLRIRLLHQKEKTPTARQVFILGWTGMRGVVSLAAAIALPVTLANGAAFPRRNLIIFLTFSVIVVTLALQGITLPALIRLLHLAGAAGPNCEEREARRILTQAALSHLQAAKARDESADADVYDDLASHYRHRLANLNSGEADQAEGTAHARYVELSIETLRVERRTAIRLRDEGRINDEVLRRLERELDLNEVRFMAPTE
jgi:CPA1 family monovalent cation:H+ antiporter